MKLTRGGPGCSTELGRHSSQLKMTSEKGNVVTVHIHTLLSVSVLYFTLVFKWLTFFLVILLHSCIHSNRKSNTINWQTQCFILSAVNNNSFKSFPCLILLSLFLACWSGWTSSVGTVHLCPPGTSCSTWQDGDWNHSKACSLAHLVVAAGKTNGWGRHSWGSSGIVVPWLVHMGSPAWWLPQGSRSVCPKSQTKAAVSCFMSHHWKSHSTPSVTFYLLEEEN